MHRVAAAGGRESDGSGCLSRPKSYTGKQGAARYFTIVTSPTPLVDCLTLAGFP